MDTQELYDFVHRIDAKKIVDIHDNTFRNYFLKRPEDIENYVSQHGLADLQALFSEIEAFTLTAEKTRVHLKTLKDGDKVKFFDNEFTIEEIDLHLSGREDEELHDRFTDFYFSEPWSASGYDVFMYQLHKEFIADKIEQRDKRMDEIFED